MNHSKGFLLALVLALLGLSALLVEPFVQYVLGAVLLAYVLYPLQVRLEAHTSPMVAASLLVSLATAGLVVPFGFVLVTIVERADDVLRRLSFDSAAVESAERRVLELTGLEVDVGDQLAETGREFGRVVVERSVDVVGTLAFHLLGVVLALFLLYYLLKDGADLHRWLRETTPLPADTQRALADEIDDVMWGVVFGHVSVGVVQGVVAGLGFFVAGVPNAPFWTAVMVVMAMVPLVGTIPIWGGAVVHLYLVDEPALAAGLFVYSVVVVGLTDDYLRPFAVDRYAKLNPAVVLLGILGGSYAFGVMGLFFGPVLLGALRATLGVLAEYWNRDGETA
ncbi:AI-2E family transporter [Halobacterium yunchengense]|uniref:AI-2E family transporter n=1 Tax=Halobacterium yunchengense TaxID=3108497 RepID=UPI00300B2A41